MHNYLSHFLSPLKFKKITIFSLERPRLDVMGVIQHWWVVGRCESRVIDEFEPWNRFPIVTKCYLISSLNVIPSQFVIDTDMRKFYDLAWATTWHYFWIHMGFSEAWNKLLKRTKFKMPCTLNIFVKRKKLLKIMDTKLSQ